MPKKNVTPRHLPRMPALQARYEDYGGQAKAIIKAELKRAQLTYGDLAERLTARGEPISEPTLRNKLSRGSFSAAFFIGLLFAIGSDVIRLYPTTYFDNEGEP